MKLAGIILCHNEAKMVKYVMPYWERIGIDKLIVYDNMSTDNSVELLSKYPFVEIRQFDTGGKFCDTTNARLKSVTYSELKNSGYDWIFIGDFDEVVFCSNPNFREELQKIETLGGDIFNRDMVQPFTIEPIKYDESKLIHEQMPLFITWHDDSRKWGGSKTILVKTERIDKVSFTHGAHTSYITISEPYKTVKNFGYPFIALHLKYVDSERLESISDERHNRIFWRTEMPRCSEASKKHLLTRYSELKGDSLINKLNRFYDKCEKLKTMNWEEFMKYYNENYLVDIQKFKNNSNILPLSYDNIDMSIFYKVV